MGSTRVSYFGSKATSGLCQPIIAMMPPHDTYIETHLGGGAIMKRKPPALHNIGIDLDPQPLVDFECDYPVQRINGCAHQFLTEYEYQGSELIYSDPPYLRRTRYCRISSYLQTMANQGYNPLVAIQLALSGQLYADTGE